MVNDNISISKGRAICYICNKKIDGDIYSNNVDKRYYCCEEHAINRKSDYLEEKRSEKEQLLQEEKIYEAIS